MRKINVLTRARGFIDFKNYSFFLIATNQQGQTYVVAQQTPQIPQTVLLAQSPGQQGSQTKTIIILQQPQGQHGHGQIQVQPHQSQKIIMTPSGQQVIYSSPVQRQTIGQQVIQVSQPSIIQSTSTQSAGRKIVITNAPSDQTKIIHNVQQQTPTKIVQHASSQQTLQAIAQGQNIIVQKGQKFQIGSTQISQVITPAPSPQILQQTVVQQVVQPQQQVTKVIQKTETPSTAVAPPTQTPPPSTVVIKETTPVVEQKKIESPVVETSPMIPTTVNQEQTAKQNENNENSNESTPATTNNAAKAEEGEASKEKEKTPTSSGSSSPAPNGGQNKQTISIQIPVPQSQLAGANAQQYTIKIIPSMDPSVKVKDEDVDPSWLYICEWRGCPKKKFNSANEVYLHACAIHCPSLEGNPDL